MYGMFYNLCAFRQFYARFSRFPGITCSPIFVLFLCSALSSFLFLSFSFSLFILFPQILLQISLCSVLLHSGRGIRCSSHAAAHGIESSEDENSKLWFGSVTGDCFSSIKAFCLFLFPSFFARSLHLALCLPRSCCGFCFVFRFLSDGGKL